MLDSKNNFYIVFGVKVSHHIKKKVTNLKNITITTDLKRDQELISYLKLIIYLMTGDLKAEIFKIYYNQV